MVTKLEAFKGRGGGDYLLSHDIEDIVAVLDGRPEIADEVISADGELKHEVAVQFRELLKNRKFIDAVSGHMPTDETSQARVQVVLNCIKKISE